METQEQTIVHIETIVNAPVEKVWKFWNEPEHITQWNQASPDWHAPWATNELKPGGRLVCRMEARDGSFGFDFGGTYDKVSENEYLEYTLDDNRKVSVTFAPVEGGTYIKESFEAESTNPVEMQQMGWQAILDSFKRYTETH